MGLAAILAAIDMVFSLAARLYSAAKMIAGTMPIPTLDEIYKKNMELQAKIDAEK